MKYGRDVVAEDLRDKKLTMLTDTSQKSSDFIEKIFAKLIQ